MSDDTITYDTRVHRNPDVAFRELATGDGGVLLHLVSGSYHGVNQIGALIWELLDGTRTTAEVAAEVRQHVDDSPEQLEADVLSFIADLRERDLVA